MSAKKSKKRSNKINSLDQIDDIYAKFEQYDTFHKKAKIDINYEKLSADIEKFNRDERIKRKQRLLDEQIKIATSVEQQIPDIEQIKLDEVAHKLNARTLALIVKQLI
jgi:hypothetical protein